MWGLSLNRVKDGWNRLPFRFSFTETMSGEHKFSKGKKAANGPQAFSFTLTATADPLTAAIDWSRAALIFTAHGNVQAEGINQESRLAGTLEIDLFSSHEIRYQFEFRGADRQTYCFSGKKNVSFWSPWKSMTTLYGEISRKKTGAVVSTALVNFPASQLAPFILSARLALSR
ncbi:MAG: hypothetical protein C4523_13700 [Myxococcales bacterium]|nr:MAG: hypothetical protein C4523_13700 [Myxococcales bacterium]